jgi:hypothetical protein
MEAIILITLFVALVILAVRSHKRFNKIIDEEYKPNIRTDRTVFPLKGEKDWYGH